MTDLTGGVRFRPQGKPSAGKRRACAIAAALARGSLEPADRPTPPPLSTARPTAPRKAGKRSRSSR